MTFTAFELAEKLAKGRESAEKSIARYCPVPVFTADEKGRWQSANEPMQRLMAQTEGQLNGDRWLMRVHPAALEQVEKDYSKAVTSKVSSSTIHLHCCAADGREFCAYMTLFQSSGSFVGFILPVCSTPVECPVHCFLLHNIEPKKI